MEEDKKFSVIIALEVSMDYHVMMQPETNMFSGFQNMFW
jgi:hypothetical protein